MIENTDHKRDRDTLADVGLGYPGDGFVFWDAS